MNEALCSAANDRRPTAKFPDIPPADLCRRHSCLDNFVLSGCVAKASDNLTRLDELLRRQRLIDTVKRSYRAAVARTQSSGATMRGSGKKDAGREFSGGGKSGSSGGGDARGGSGVSDAADEVDESRSARRMARQSALLVDGHPSTGRIAQDVHGLLENLGTLLRRLERDIHKTWSRILDLEAASAAVQGDMRSTSAGCTHKLEQSISTILTDWSREEAMLNEERGQAQLQATTMASSIAALQQRVGAIGQYVNHVRDEAATIGEEGRQDLAQLKELKERVRLMARQRRQEAQRAVRVRQLLHQQKSDTEIRTLQRVVRRKQLTEKLQVSRRDATATTSALRLAESELVLAESEAHSRAVQVSQSLTELSQISHQELPQLDGEEPARSVEAVYVTVKDAVTQAVQRLAQVRSRQIQTELACRDQAIQLGKLAIAEEMLAQEQENLEIEIEGVKINKVVSTRKIRKNVNVLTARAISARKKIKEAIVMRQEAAREADDVEPEIYELKGDIRDTKVKLTAVQNKQEPILAKLAALRRRYQEEEEEERRRINLAKGEVDYQGEVRHELEAQLLTTQSLLHREFERYELTLAERETLEDSFVTRMAIEQPQLGELLRENAAIVRKLADLAHKRCSADRFIDEHGAAVMTQKVALAFEAEVRETKKFELEQQVQRVTAELEESRRLETEHTERISQLKPRRDALAEEIQCLDSELHWRRASDGAQLDRLREMTQLVADWERLRDQHLAQHEQFLRQARGKTDALTAEYERGVLENVELRQEYGALVERWLAARMRTAIRFLPQLTVRTDLCGRLQVVRLVRAGVHATDRTLGLRHLYYSGEHQRGQARLGELYNTVRVMRDEIALASEHVVRMFIGLMKGDVPFVRHAERGTEVRDDGAQTDAELPVERGDREREERERRQRQREMVMRVAEMGRADTAHCGLPPVRKHGEKPVRGVGTMHSKDSKLHSQTPRLPKI